jgi:signal transduction histidine kinase
MGGRGTWGGVVYVTPESVTESTPTDVAGLLHDLKQPLVAIRVLATVPDPSSGQTGPPPDLTERLRRIGEMGTWMNELLRTGHEFIAHEHGTADVVDAVQDVILAAATSYTGRLCWRPTGPVEVPVQPAELRRAIGNVVDNAVRAAGPGGRVTVRVRQTRDRVSVLVDDTGPGLGAVEAQTGRGLQVTRTVLHRAGGWLSINSRRSGGVRVRMVFPLARPDESM